MEKRGINFIFLFVFAIFLIGFISSASCSITTSCASSNTVMKLSSSTNAHGALWDGTYNNYLCCDFIGTHTCDGSNTVLRLSSSTNAHAEIPSGTTYTSRICFGNLSCYNAVGSCTVGDTQMVSLSSTTNAHIGGFNDYPTKICCKFPAATPICGDGKLEGTEVCDDNNIISGDGCSLTCTIESGYITPCVGTPSCCQLNIPTTSWLRNGVAFSGGEIKAGDILTMRFNEDFCLASGTSITFSIYKGTTVMATATGTVVQGTPGYTSATYTVTQSFLSSLGTTSNIFFRITNPRTLDNTPQISVIPRYCGDGTCTSANGETCSTCVADCGCTVSQECLSGSCVGLCDLTTATWNQTTALTGQPVRLNVGGTNCAGKTISFIIMEKDGFANADDPVIPNPTNIVFSGTSSYAGWNTVFQDDTDGGQSNPPEYYFIASVVGYSESITSSNTAVTDSLLLTVNQPVLCPNGIANPGETCSTCPQDVPCGSGYRCDAGTQTCVLDCVLSNPVWNMTNAVGGQRVQVRVQGTNCNGQSVSFEIREDDSPLGYDLVRTNPLISIMSSSLAIGTWTAEWPDMEGETAPEYYFTANVNVLGKTIESSRSSLDELHVTQNLVCGDGIVSNPNTAGFSETCDDGGTISGDGCSSICTIESGYSCTSSPSICSLICGNGIINAPETCDGANLNGATCIGELGTGWTGTPSCNTNNCTLNLAQCIAPPVCVISSAAWSTINAVEGDQVQLNIQTANCANGQIVSFIVKEDDTGLFSTDDNAINNPLSVSINLNSATGNWIAEWPDTKGETNPEYYFTATIVNSNPVRSLQSTNELNVTQNPDAQCSGIGSCISYTTEESCEIDTCDVGKNSVPGIVSCGGSFNSITGCYDYTNCGCNWNGDSGECEPSLSEESSCGICGNGIRDYPERCDDGNTIDGDGCSSDCQFESGIENPCSEGLTLCSDGTCSLNCYSTDEGVASCNYDSSCQEGTEGCTCSDCKGEKDTCEEGLVCNIFNYGCCSSASDDVCNPYCSYVDPDCSLGAECGNGYRETGEECDLGTRNLIPDSGCSDICKFEIIDPTENGGCPEGTALCNDGTCSLNCYATDEGVDDGDFTQCQTNLEWSVVDQACCNEDGDVYCNPYCASSDPDCATTPVGNLFPGTCTWTETGTDTCEDDSMLTRSLSALWTWDVDNTFITSPDSADSSYWQPDLPLDTVYRYDPTDDSGFRKSQSCNNVEDTLVCPASVKVPFFGIYSFVIAIIIVVLIYIIYFLRKKNNSNSKKGKKK